MRRYRTHLQGSRGKAFLKLVRGVPREQIICVSVDVHKYYHKVLIHDGYGQDGSACHGANTRNAGDVVVQLVY